MLHLARIDAEAGYHGRGRTIGIVQQFRRMVTGWPAVVAFDGTSYRVFHGYTDYDSLLAFAADRIPYHISNLPSKQGFSFLKNSQGKPRALLISNHRSTPILFRHVAFELHQWIDFGFVPWQEGGALQQEYGLKKAPVLLIQKESYLPPTIVHQIPTERKALLRLLKAHRFDWVQELGPDNFKEVCEPRSAKKDTGHWCIVFLAAGSPRGNHVGLSAMSAIAMHQEWSDLLPVATTFARMDSVAQKAYLTAVFSQVNKADVQCIHWSAPSCFLAINTKRREFVTWPRERPVSSETLVEWLKELSSELQSGKYTLRRQGGSKTWPDLVVVDSSGLFGSISDGISPASIILIMMAGFVLLGPPGDSKKKARPGAKPTGTR